MARASRQWSSRGHRRQGPRVAAVFGSVPGASGGLPMYPQKGPLLLQGVLGPCRGLGGGAQLPLKLK
eukprot:7062613-Lingulodinium_polyedra.AAC.1